jgi:hypothetical protein
MSEPILERMSRFTPDAGGLDRDALLFAAGRGSARPNRGWIALATMLASSQVLSLVLLWPRPTLPEGRVDVAVAVASSPSPPATLEVPAVKDSVTPGAWSAGQRLLKPPSEDFPNGSVTLIDSGPPLKVFGPLPASLLN